MVSLLFKQFIMYHYLSASCVLIKVQVEVHSSTCRLEGHTWPEFVLFWCLFVEFDTVYIVDSIKQTALKHPFNDCYGSMYTWCKYQTSHEESTYHPEAASFIDHKKYWTSQHAVFKWQGHVTFVTYCIFLLFCACVLYSISTVVMDVFRSLDIFPSEMLLTKSGMLTRLQCMSDGFIFSVAYVRYWGPLVFVNRGWIYTFSVNTSSVSRQLWWHRLVCWAVQMAGYCMCEYSMYGCRINWAALS